MHCFLYRIMILLAACTICLSCKERLKKVDLTDLRDTELRIETKEVFDSITFVELRTNGQCMLGVPYVFSIWMRRIFS